MLPGMDRIFGTHYLPREWPSAYGIDTELPDSLGRQLVHPFFPQSAASEAAIAPRLSSHPST